eukprot:COSAG02_NODE_4865_length_4888_cov_2.731259_5_plen_58_part_00
MGEPGTPVGGTGHSRGGTGHTPVGETATERMFRYIELLALQGGTQDFAYLRHTTSYL